MVELLVLLVAAHFICDTVLQPEHVSKYKNPYAEKPVNWNQTTWPYYLIGHASMHGMAVYVLTGKFEFLLLEIWWHFFIDFYKCEGAFGTKFNMHIDQVLHLLCKVFYVYVLYKLGGVT